MSPNQFQSIYLNLSSNVPVSTLSLFLLKRSFLSDNVFDVWHIPLVTKAYVTFLCLRGFLRTPPEFNDLRYPPIVSFLEGFSTLFQASLTSRKCPWPCFFFLLYSSRPHGHSANVLDLVVVLPPCRWHHGHPGMQLLAPSPYQTMLRINWNLHSSKSKMLNLRF